jgi:uncharacterized protein YabE (DUF348 family)/3D (Asp-Asp-Asp) domain-containing protein
VIIRSGNELKVERAVPVTVEADGQLLAWRTRAIDLRALMDEMGIEVGAYDGLILNGHEVSIDTPVVTQNPDGAATAAVPANGLNLSVIRAVPLTIVEDGLTISLKTTRPTVAVALRDAGIRLGPADEVYPSPATPVVAGLEIEVKHAKTINLRTGSGTRVIYTHKESLEAALAEAGFALGSEDRVEPSIEAAVTNGMTARLVRVAGRAFTEKEPLPRKTVFSPDENLGGFNTRIVQGTDGVLVREYKVVIEDGVETERSLVKEYMDPEPKDTVIYYAASTIRATGAVPENYKVITSEKMWATWYNAASSGKANTDPSYGITKTGVPVTRGIVAVDPAVIPLGSRLYIPGYGFAVAADTGGGIKGNMVDLGYADGAAVDWHTGWTDVYLLAP